MYLCVLHNRYRISLSQMTTEYVPFAVITIQPLILIPGFVIRVTLGVKLVEQELLTLPEHLSSPPIFSGVRVARFLIFCVVFCKPLFVLILFFFLWPLHCLSFDLRLLISPVIGITSIFSCI